MRTSNPALNTKMFASAGGFASTAETMTIQGTVNKTGLLLLFLVLSAGMVWYKFFQLGQGPAAYAGIMPWMMTGLIGGMIAALVTIFKKSWAAITAPLYALFEGCFIGGLSAIMELQFKGIVLPAVGLTFGTLFCLLAAYKTGIIRASEKFKLGIFAATGAVALIYIVSMILGFFGVAIPFIHSSGPIGIGFSAVVVVIAALNLILDFDIIENGAAYGAPKYMEWYAGFALLVTLVWLYLEILRLLSKLRSRR